MRLVSSAVLCCFTLQLTQTGAQYCTNSASDNCEMSANYKERTFLAIKPDAVNRALIGDIIKRFEQRGYKLVAMKMMHASVDHLKEHYKELSQKPFFARLIKYMHSGPVVAMVWEGLEIVKQARQMLGETNPLNSKPGSIRGDFSILTGFNIVHGSDSVESAQREIALWFQQEEIVDWHRGTDVWIYE